MSFTKSKWYINRVRTFSIAEIQFRIRQMIQKKCEKHFCSVELPKIQSVKTTFCLPELKIISNQIYPESISIFGKSFNYSEEIVDWHKDIFSGKCFPLKFSKEINIRENNDLSAKNVWEINRLHFLPHIALNFRTSGDKKYLSLFIDITTSWIEKNPYLIGINWYSNIEINIRLINWFLCWHILEADKLVVKDESFKSFVETKWLPAVYQHCIYSYRNPSKYSSSNNHLIAEYSGLFVASSLWAFPESKTWIYNSRMGLEKEIIRQHSSGINREEAAEYIQFITDFFLLPFIIGEKTGHPFSEEYRETLREIFLYTNSILDCKGNFPKYGDEDDGRCYVLDTGKEFENFKSLLTSATIIFKDQQFKSGSNGFDFKNRILFGEEGRILYDSIKNKTALEQSWFFENEGHFTFRKKENGKEVYLHFNAAPLGFLSIAAHGHADALSFIMHINGQQVFTDSGTYTYHTEPDWRKYFIGTIAHNTVRINYHDQALNGGPTLWLNHYKTWIIHVKMDALVEHVIATHNGYKKDGIKHFREVLFDRIKTEFIITDTILVQKKGNVKVEIPFHLHPSVYITTSKSNQYILTVDTSTKILFSVDDRLRQEVIKGQVSPQLLGWYSNSFLKKEPTNVIYCTADIDRKMTYSFKIKIS